MAGSFADDSGNGAGIGIIEIGGWQLRRGWDWHQPPPR